MSFRIGRKHAQHTYPQAVSGGPGLAGYARNFAQGPAANQAVPVSPGTLLTPWNPIESGAAPGSTVPITPKVTGLVLVTGTIEGAIAVEGEDNLFVQIDVDGVPLLNPITGNPVGTGTGSGFMSVSFCVLAQLIVGETHHIGVIVSSSSGDVALNAHNSTISIQEVAAATG
jgi:hypothetical protein